MENASKALLMAGGVLIALLVIGALMLMINAMGDYHRNQSALVKDSQVAQFNSEFEKYIDEESGIYGMDIISVINKVIDFNKKVDNGGLSNSVNYEEYMEIKITGMSNFNNLYATSISGDKLFPNDSYTINGTGENVLENILKNAANVFQELQNDVGKNAMVELSNLTEKYNPNYNKQVREILEKYSPNVADKWMNQISVLKNNIKYYKQYTEFKTAKFKKTQEPYYKDGQIQKLYFKFVVE